MICIYQACHHCWCCTAVSIPWHARVRGVPMYIFIRTSTNPFNPQNNGQRKTSMSEHRCRRGRWVRALYACRSRRLQQPLLFKRLPGTECAGNTTWLRLLAHPDSYRPDSQAMHQVYIPPTSQVCFMASACMYVRIMDYDDASTTWSHRHTCRHLLLL